MKVYVTKYYDEYNWYSKYINKYIDVDKEPQKIYGGDYFRRTSNQCQVIPIENVDIYRYRKEKLKNIL